MWLHRAGIRCARGPTSCLPCAAFHAAASRRRLRRDGRASSVQLVYVRGSWRENYSGLRGSEVRWRLTTRTTLAGFARLDGRGCPSSIDCDYSMLDPSGVYLYLLPSQKTTDVA